MTLPGLTTATHPSGEPLPEPMRVSAGFFVTGLSGKRLIQTFPPRLILRVIAIRAASICRFVSQPASSDFSPYSPNWTVVWPLEVPARRPRWCLRNLVFFGSSMASAPALLAARRACALAAALLGVLVTGRVELGRVLVHRLRRGRVRRVRDRRRRRLDLRLDHRLLAALGRDSRLVRP